MALRPNLTKRCALGVDRVHLGVPQRLQSQRARITSWASTATKVVAGSYVSLLALLFVFQRRIIFPGTMMSALDPESTGGKLVNAVDGSTALHFPAPPGAATLIYFHGNGDQLGAGPAHIGAYMSRRGLGFYAVEYPGFGVAPGSASEATMLSASETLVQHLISEIGVPRDNIVLFGQSIGCVPAFAMSAKGYGVRNIMVSPFSSLHSMALDAYGFLYPVSWLLRWMLLDTCDNLAAARQVTSPTLVIHGDNDDIVPFSHGLQIEKELKQCQSKFQPVGGAHHNDILEKKEAMEAIIAFAKQRSSL